MFSEVVVMVVVGEGREVVVAVGDGFEILSRGLCLALRLLGVWV